MLSLVGLGLDDDEITQKGMRALENSDEAYAEFYTNTKTVDLERLEKETDTSIEELDRPEVEQDMIPVKRAEDSDIVFLVSGDPLTATTHFQLKKEAKERGIKTSVVHAPSILTSIAETGLDVYRFGRTVTIPSDMNPDSIGEQISQNDSIGLHTLVLFDINLPADQAASKLLEIDEELKERGSVVLERANSEDQSISLGTLSEIAERDFGETPHCLVIIGELTHKEEEFLEDLR